MKWQSHGDSDSSQSLEVRVSKEAWSLFVLKRRHLVKENTNVTQPQGNIRKQKTAVHGRRLKSKIWMLTERDIKLLERTCLCCLNCAMKKKKRILPFFFFSLMRIKKNRLSLFSPKESFALKILVVRSILCFTLQWRHSEFVLSPKDDGIRFGKAPVVSVWENNWKIKRKKISGEFTGVTKTKPMTIARNFPGRTKR